MNAMTVAQRMTAQEFLAQPFDEVRSELVGGEVIVEQPALLHQRILWGLGYALHTWTLAAPGRGGISLPIDVLLDERNVFGPDLLWYAEGRVPARDAERPYPMPNLVIEVRSPSTWRYDIGAKKSAYERYGLPELWLVDTSADEILVFRRSARTSASFDVSLELGRGDTLASALLPGFTLALDALFES
jgi:Uma2 family endonuclease